MAFQRNRFAAFDSASRVFRSSSETSTDSPFSTCLEIIVSALILTRVFLKRSVGSVPYSSVIITHRNGNSLARTSPKTTFPWRPGRKHFRTRSHRVGQIVGPGELRQEPGAVCERAVRCYSRISSVSDCRRSIWRCCARTSFSRLQFHTTKLLIQLLPGRNHHDKSSLLDNYPVDDGCGHRL